MAPKFRIAASLPESHLVADSVERARWAERVGYDDLWIADGSAPDALTLAAVLAGATQRLRIGTAVTPVYTRPPALFAATANVLAQIMPGRFVLGLGSSSETMIAGWNGVPFEKPMSRVKDTLVMVRSMLKGEKSAFDLETLKSHGYRQAPLEQPVPIYLAALRSRMIETAVELADGVIFNLWPRKALSKMMGHVRIGAERGHKDPANFEIVHRHHVLVTDDKPRGRALFRGNFVPYYATSVYNSFLAWGGFEEIAAAIREGWAAKDRDKTSRALTDALVDEIAVIGPEEECRARIRWAAKSGVHTHIIAPMQGASPEERQRSFECFRDFDWGK